MSKYQLKGPAPATADTAAPADPEAFVRGGEPTDIAVTRPMDDAPRIGHTKNFSLRIEADLQAKIDRVFRHSTYKSKQQMVIELLTKALDGVPQHSR